MDRKENLARVLDRQEPWDIVVIGGGATGVGCAVDAASRGYDVLLLEQHDFGKGTSSRSTKLVHGGVRYLRQGNISLVHEALRERGILLRNAPHVVHKQAFIIPCYGLWQKAFYGIGLKIYDLLAGKHSFGRSKTLLRAETIRQLQTVNTDGLSGGVLYYDGQFDDTRLLIDLVTTAHIRGAAVLNYARVTSLTKSRDGNISGVEFHDMETGDTFSPSAKAVINATGVFCDPIRSLSDESAKPVIKYSQGIHLVFDRKFLPSDTALMIPKTNDGRVLFCIPWHGYTLVGTTDTPVAVSKLEPAALESEIDFVLETVGNYLTEPPTRDDILSIFAGIRPLVKRGHATKTSAISRGHDLFVDDAGLVTITGGKWTTYRRMAEDAVDKAIAVGSLAKRECITERLEIKPPEAENDETPLHPDLPYSVGDVVRAVRTEMAQTVEDVLARRTRALFLNARAAVEATETVARIIANETSSAGYDVDKDVAEFRAVAANYLGSSKRA